MPEGDAIVEVRPDVEVMHDLWVGGWSYSAIADRFKIGQKTVENKLRRYRSQRTRDERETILVRESELLDHLRRRLLEIVDGDAMPAYQQGRPIKDADGEPVDDHSQRLAAIDRLLRIQERQAKMLGLDAPARTEVITTEQVTDAARLAADRARGRLEAAAAGAGATPAGTAPAE